MTSRITSTVTLTLFLLLICFASMAQNEIEYTFSPDSDEILDATVTFGLAGIQNEKMLYSSVMQDAKAYIGWSRENSRWELKMNGQIVFYNSFKTELYPPCVGIGEWKLLNPLFGNMVRMTASNKYCYPFVYYSSDCTGSYENDFFFTGMRNGKYSFSKEVSESIQDIYWNPYVDEGMWVVRDRVKGEILFYNSTDTTPLPPDEETGIWTGNGDCSRFSIVGSGGNVLPSGLLSFKVEHRANGYEAIWTTSRELNVDRFELEYSRDQQNWISLSSIKGQGSYASGMNYYVKFGAGVGNTEFYVRLIQYNTDDKFKTFPYVYMQPPELTGPFNFYPNPAHNDLIVEGRIGSQLVIFNSVGETLIEHVLDEAQLVLDISTLPKGLYIIESSGLRHAYNKKLIKK